MNASSWNSEKRRCCTSLKENYSRHKRGCVQRAEEMEHNVKAVSLLWRVSLTLSGAFKRGSCSVTRSRVHGKGGRGGGWRGWSGVWWGGVEWGVGRGPERQGYSSSMCAPPGLLLVFNLAFCLRLLTHPC